MAIIGNLELLSKRLPDDPQMRRMVSGAIQSAERGSALTQRLLAFARRQELRPEAVDVRKLITGVLEMLRRSLGPSVDIGTAFDDGLALIRVDPNQLELALLNLALNARDAMPDGGRMTIAARRATIAGHGHELVPGDYVAIAVSDTGVGMDEATLVRA